MDFNIKELVTMYFGVELLRNNNESELDILPEGAFERNGLVDDIKACNSAMRKLKKILLERKVDIWNP